MSERGQLIHRPEGGSRARLTAPTTGATRIRPAEATRPMSSRLCDTKAPRCRARCITAPQTLRAPGPPQLSAKTRRVGGRHPRADPTPSAEPERRARRGFLAIFGDLGGGAAADRRRSSGGGRRVSHARRPHGPGCPLLGETIMSQNEKVQTDCETHVSQRRLERAPGRALPRRGRSRYDHAQLTAAGNFRQSGGGRFGLLRG